jgi:hypothetical protein
MWRFFFFFGVFETSHGVEKKNEVLGVLRIFLGQKEPNMAIFWGQFFFWIRHLENTFLRRLPKQSKFLKYLYFPFMTFSQIWLIPFVDGGQFTYLTKLKRKIPG